MYSEGFLHIFTGLLGWHYYGYMWAILSGTGLVFVPILGVIIDHIVQVRSRGSLINNDGENAFSGLEVQLFVIMLVILIAAVPTSFTQITAGEVKYNSPATVYGEAEVATIDDPKSTFDSATDKNISLTSTAANAPAWWYLVIRISQGIRQTFVDNLDNKGAAFRAIKRQANQASIKNPELREHIDTFYTYCYLPALSKMNKTKDSTLFLSADTADRTTIGPDIGWIGSQYLQDNFYGELRVPVLVSGYEFSSTISTEYDSTQDGGQPMCDEYWAKISTAIYAEASSDGMVSLREEIRTWVPDWIAGQTEVEAKQSMVKIYLDKTPVQTLLGADQIIALKDGDSTGFLDNTKKFAEETATAYKLAEFALAVEIGVDALIYALSIGQAYILMILYMMLPIGLLVSRYSIGYLMNAGLLIFMVIFWSVLWAMVAWLDNIVAQSMYTGNILETLANGGLGEFNKRLAHSLAIAALYVFAPVIASWVILVAGSRAGQVLSHTAAGAVGGIASASVGGAAAAAGTKQLAKSGGRKIMGRS